MGTAGVSIPQNLELQSASALCEPYGIKVADEVGLSEVFDNFASQPGETVAKALLRLARLRGVDWGRST